MPGNTRHVKRVEATFKYAEEISEEIAPRPGKPEIVLGPAEYVKIRKWHVTRVFYFLILSSALCLTAVAVAPQPAVQATAVAVWLATAGLARYLLADSYRHPGGKPPAE
jgi:hypothetical protein